MNIGRNVALWLFVLVFLGVGASLSFIPPVRVSAEVAPGSGQVAAADNPNPPSAPVKLIFLHHSTGGYWLSNGGLGQALMNNNYYVSATNYGWGPDGVGNRTDIFNWPEWFTGPNRSTIMQAVYSENGQSVGEYGAWPRLASNPGGGNEIVMFKSCYPNSKLSGNPNDPAAATPNDWQLSVSNAKAVYNNILTYFATRQDKLFIVIAAPPERSSETSASEAANARAFNTWLLNDWLKDYPYKNVAVFDFYNVLTSNNGNANTNDAGLSAGNHHRWWQGAVQHTQTVASNYLAYPTSPSDSHPSAAGGQKATAEFVPLLNVFYHRWKDSQSNPPPTETTTTTAVPSDLERRAYLPAILR